MTPVARALAIALLFVVAPGHVLFGDDSLVERPDPPAHDDFETDKNKDGVPDGWYNLRDGKLVAEGGIDGPHCMRFEMRKPGRPARLSRAFGVDGRKYEAIVLGLWVRTSQIQAGERLGEEPSLIIDFLGDELRALSRGMLGPWPKSYGTRWVHMAKRLAVPPGTHDAIMSVGLIGATGVLEIDGLTIELVPRGGEETTNLVSNGDFELGTPDPVSWTLDHGAQRAFPGYRSKAMIELAKPGARAMTGLAIRVQPFAALEVSVAVKTHGLRGAGGAAASFFFLDDDGQILPGSERGLPAFHWSGSSDWETERVVVPVPPGAIRAVFQIEKSDTGGWIRLDNLSITASPNPAAGAWVPFHVEDDTSGWLAVKPSTGIEAGSALDASFLLEAPAGKHGFVTVRDGRLHFGKGKRARFFGVALVAPTAFIEPARADALADRLARSGINLVRLGDLDTPLGPDLSLFEDSRDDTKAFDSNSLAKLDHLIAALKSRGIYVALELQSARRFRGEDGIDDPGTLPLGGGPASVFDPAIAKRALESAKALLAHVNPETGLPLRDDPALAWVTLAGEISLFDLIDNPDLLPSDYAKELRALAAKTATSSGRRFWQATESQHWKEMADELRRDGLRVPIASVSHWRREAEFSAGLAATGLALVDDRLYWNPPSWFSPDRRSVLWSLDGGLAAGAGHKRKTDRPYVVGQWCHQTRGAWALPLEAGDVMLASVTAASEDWDALVRRGVFLHPEVWGADATGTGGGEDVYQIPEIVNGIPQVFALWPHAASLMLRGKRGARETAGTPPGRPTASPRRVSVPGWTPERGRLVVDTAYTQGVAGWSEPREVASFDQLIIEGSNAFAVVVASSASSAPIATTKRLLVTAIARVEPTGFLWVDEWKREVADPGRPPLLQEPVEATVIWRRQGNIKAFVLDNNGTRVSEVKLKPAADGVELAIDGSHPAFHWELVVE